MSYNTENTNETALGLDLINESYKKSSNFFKLEDDLSHPKDFNNAVERLKILNDSGIINFNCSLDKNRINDDDDFSVGSYRVPAGFGVLTLPQFYLQTFKKDVLSTVIPPQNILTMSTNVVRWLGGRLTGLPDRYHDYNRVPLVNVQRSWLSRKVVTLQIATQTTLMENFFNNELQSTGVQAMSIERIKALAAQQALINGLADVTNFGVPAHGVYGLFNEPNLPPAIPLKNDDWAVGSTDNFKKIIRDISNLLLTLSNQSSIDLGALEATLVIPAKYQASFYAMDGTSNNMTVMEYFNRQYRGLRIVFSIVANESSSDNTGIILLFNNISSFMGVNTPPFINPVNLTYSTTPVSQYQDSLKVVQELYIARTAGIILVSPYDVVTAKFDK